MPGLEIKQEKAGEAKRKTESSVKEGCMNPHVSLWSKAGNKGSVITEEKQAGILSIILVKKVEPNPNQAARLHFTSVLSDRKQ